MEKIITKSDKLDYKKCSADIDLITMVEWVEKHPDIFINFVKKKDPNTDAVYSVVNCYDGESLSKYMDDEEHIFANWIAKDESKEIDKEGHGGQPGLERFYKLYTGEFIRRNKYTEGIKRGKYKGIFFDTTYLGLTLLGNVKGEFGISSLHGQFPGEDAYEIFPSKETPLEDEFGLTITKKKVDVNGHEIEVWSYLDRENVETSRESYYNGLLILRYTFGFGKEMDIREEFTADSGKLITRQYFYPDGSNDIETYEFNGKIHTLKRYDNKGKLHGESIVYFDNGNPEKITNFNHGKKDGKEEIYFSNGIKYQEIHYSDGILNGPHIFFDDDNKIEAYIEFKNGKIRRAFGDGEIVRDIAYENREDRFAYDYRTTPVPNTIQFSITPSKKTNNSPKKKRESSVKKAKAAKVKKSNSQI